MPTQVPFILPAELDLATTPEGLVLRYGGDVVLEQSLGVPVARVESGGNLTVRLPEHRGHYQARGVLTVEGRILGATFDAPEIVLDGPEIKVRVITAARRVVVRGGALAIDLVVAPKVEIGPTATGRVTLVDCDGDHGGRGVRGGFSPSEFEDMFGDPTEFAAARGVALRSDKPAPHRPAVSDEAATAPPAPVSVPPASAAVPAKARLFEERDGPVPSDFEEDVHDPVSLSVDEIEVLAEAAPGDTRLAEALRAITAAYGGDPPPVLADLRTLLEVQDRDAVRDGLTPIWDHLLAWHIQRGVRPMPQVTAAFQAIHDAIAP